MQCGGARWSLGGPWWSPGAAGGCLVVKRPKMNVSSVADKLAQDIRTQDSLHEPMVKDLGKILIKIEHSFLSFNHNLLYS